MSSHAVSLPDYSIPPHSLDAEQSVLGALLLNSSAWDDIAGLISANDFYRPEHALIFACISDLVQKSEPVDVLTLSDSLKQKGSLEKAGGFVYLAELAKNTPSLSHAQAYAKIVRERSILRRLIDVSQKISQTAFHPDGKSAHDVLDEAETKIMQIAEQNQQSQGPQKIKPLLAQALSKIDYLFAANDALTGLSTGFDDLDRATSGFSPGDLVIIAGRPSMGKTTFSVNICENACIKTGKPVLVFSMEMPAEALVMRMMSSLGRIDQTKVRSGKLDEDDWPRLHSAIHLLSDKPFYIDDTPSLSPVEVRARARRVFREQGGLGLILIDYLQLMQVPGAESRVVEISAISRSLKALAKELEVPVIALSQLNRGLEQRVNKRPIMSDLRESGAIEQDADLIAFIYRDEVYNEDSPDKGIAEIIIGKQRNGPIGTIRLAFLGKYTKFENLARDYQFESFDG
jgi:replicative DNA helicase